MRARTIAEVRTRFGEAPRHFSRSERRYLKADRPSWLSPTDRLVDQILQAEFLASEGQIVWGAVVQANSQLWQSGSEDLPGVVVVDLEGACDDSVWELSDVAHRLFEIGQSEDPQADQPLGSVEERAEVAKFLKGNLVPTPLRVPESLSGGRTLDLVTVLLCRAHFPKGVMADPLLPLLRHADASVVLPVPAAYWPERLLFAWRALGERPVARRPWRWQPVVAALVAAVLVPLLVYGAYAQFETWSQEAIARQAAQLKADAARRALAKKNATLAANLKRLKTAAPADRPALLERWRNDQGDTPGSRLAVFTLASTWPSGRTETDQPLLLSIPGIEQGELLACLELSKLHMVYRKAFLKELRKHEELKPGLGPRLTATPETPDFARLTCVVSFGLAGPEGLEALLAKQQPRWLETPAGQVLLVQVAQRAPQTLRELCEIVDLRTRREAARAIGHSTHPDAEPLRELLGEDGDAEVRHLSRPR